MQIQLLKSIVTSVAGSAAAGIVDLLYQKKNVNEFLIAKKLRLTINQTRNMLYKLADEGLVSFVRKKDSKKGGWYTYYWTLNTGKGLLKFKEHLTKQLEELERQRAYRASGRFFTCKNCALEFTEEQALSHDYTCPECGTILEMKDISSELVQLDKDAARLGNVLVSVGEEVQAMSAHEQKLRERQQRRELRKKQQARKAAMRAARKKKHAKKQQKPAAKRMSSLRKKKKAVHAPRRRR